MKVFYFYLGLILLLVSCKKSESEITTIVESEQKNIEFQFDKDFFNKNWVDIANDTISLEKFLENEISSGKYDNDFIIHFLGGLIHDDAWVTLTKDTQCNSLITLSNSLKKNGLYHQAIIVLEKTLEDYLDELKNKPQNYLTVHMELADLNYYVFNADLSFSHSLKALKIAEKYTHQIRPEDFLTLYNNFLNDIQNLNELPSYFETFKKVKITHFDTIQFVNTIDEDFKEILYRRFEIKTLASINDTANAYKKIQELKQWQPKVDTKTKMAALLSVFGVFIDNYDFDYGEYEKSLKLSKEYFAIANEYAELPRFTMLALSKLARSNANLDRFEESNTYLDIIDAKYPESKEDVNYYSLKMMKIINLSYLEKHEEVTQQLDSLYTQFSTYSLKKEIKVENLHKEDYSKINLSHFINNFASGSQCYKQAYVNTRDLNTLQKAESLALVGCKMFFQAYENSGYDYYLLNYVDKLNNSLLNIIALKDDIKAKRNQNELLEMVEKLASKQLFLQFQEQIIVNNPKIKSLFDKKVVLNQQKNTLENDLFFTDDITKAKKLKFIEKELFQFENKIKKELKSFYSINEDFELNKIQNLLNEDNCIVKFYVADDEVFRILITKDSTQTSKIEDAYALKTKVKAYLGQLKTPNSDHSELSNELFKIIWKDVPHNNISIIPQDFINYLPFETLLNDDHQALVQNKNIYYNFSLPLWYAGKVYNYKSSNQNTLCLSADYSKSNLGTLPLKHSETEIEKIAALTKGTKNNQATKAFFIENSNHFSVFHLAMHAKLDDENFENSNLLFTNDEPLYFKDFYTLNLPLDLVVLSACNTGTGAVVNGEGIMSLSRALTFSGVRSSVVSYWEVPDKETSELMELFYVNLKEGKNKDVALSQAKRDFINKYPLKNHPFFWAGFVLNGNNDSIYTTDYTYGILMGILLLFVLGYWIYKKNYFNFSNKSKA